QSMRTLCCLVVVASGCATTSRQCPLDSHLVTTDPPTGRIERCETTPGGLTALPIPGRTSPAVLGTAMPEMRTPSGSLAKGHELAYATSAPDARAAREELPGMSQPMVARSGMHGPFTHWHPNGAVESHGSYVDDGTASVPDG